MKKFIKADNDVNAIRQRHLDAYQRRAKKGNSDGQSKLKEILESDDPLQTAFDAFVPSSGQSDVFIGEVARAFMKILYRDMNDGDRFYSGYGIETCGDCVAYLCDVLPDLLDSFKGIANRTLEGQAYTDEIQTMAQDTIQNLAQQPELALRENKDDMYDFDGAKFMEDNELIPMYEFECDYPEELADHIEKGNISISDIQDEVSSWEFFRNDDAVVNANDWGLYITDITEDTYHELEDSLQSELEYWASDLTNEYGDPHEYEDY